MHTEYVILPPVPEHLIETIPEILAKDLRSKRGPYETRHVSAELLSFLEGIFNAKVEAQYQIFDIRIPIHIDTTRSRVYNYIIETGGSSVSTSFYDDAEVLLYSTILQPKRWHYIDTLIKHGIHGIEPNKHRVSIGVQSLRKNGEISVPIPGIMTEGLTPIIQ